MNWFGWFLVAWYAANAIYVITQVGKPSKPTSPGVAAFCVIAFAGFIVCLLTVGTGR